MEIWKQIIVPVQTDGQFFGMAAMKFPYDGILLIQGNLVNLPRIFPMSTLRQASFPIHYFKLF